MAALIPAIIKFLMSKGGGGGGGGGKKPADPNKAAQAAMAKTDFGKRTYQPLSLGEEPVPPPVGGRPKK